MSNTKKYKIVCIQHLLKNNKKGKSGEVYPGTAFINLQASIDGGYVKEVKGKGKSKPEAKTANEAGRAKNESGTKSPESGNAKS